MKRRFMPARRRKYQAGSGDADFLGCGLGRRHGCCFRDLAAGEQRIAGLAGRFGNGDHDAALIGAGLEITMCLNRLVEIEDAIDAGPQQSGRGETVDRLQGLLDGRPVGGNAELGMAGEIEQRILEELDRKSVV